ncbi:MAG: hypothetical protein ABF293_08115 [Flavobacteriaceae bacterium]
MASIRDLKKDINNVFGDIIEAVYILEDSKENQESKEGTAIIESAITAFDELIAQVNKRDVENRSAHLEKVRADLEKKAKTLIDKVNKLG